jgi:hypothetical protein
MEVKTKMPFFELRNSDINRAIASFLEKTHEELKVDVSEDRIHIKTKFAIELNKLELGSAIPSLTDVDWAHLYRQISKTVMEGRVWPPRRSFDRAETWVIRVKLLKTRRVEILFDPIEYGLVEQASKLVKKCLADFIRVAVMSAVDEEFDKEALHKQEEREQEKLKQSEKKPQRYVT